MVSVIIPVYNKADTLGMAIESVCAQTLGAWELIVVDDGSTDDVMSAMAPYASDPRIRLIRQENAGVSAARNRGIQAAREPYLAFLDADDEWLPRHLEDLKTMIEQEPGAGVYATPFRVQFADGRSRDTSAHFIREGIWREKDAFAYMYRMGGQHMMNLLGACIQADAARACGGFQAGERIGEDTDFLLHVAAYNDVVLWNRVSAVYHRERSTATEQAGPLNYDWYFQKREKALLSDARIPAEKRFYIRCLLDHFRIHKARHYLMEGRKKRAMEEMRRVRWDAKKWRARVITWCMVPVPSRVLRYLYREKRKRVPV